jgi:3-hydroxybutyryl-CoA dehydrogenase
VELKKVGIVGCGQMGGGIALVCAQADFDVIVSEVNQDLLNKGTNSLKAQLTRNMEKGKISNDRMNDTLTHITGTTNMTDFSDCDLIIEAAVENMAVKKKIFGELDKICKPTAIFATNTSSLSVIDVAMATNRPDKVIGLHFFNPVPTMKLLEIVNTVSTNNETLEDCKKFGAKIGKEVIVAKDTPSFIVNRLLVPFLLDAIRMYENGIASKEDIDNGVVFGLNHPLGPLTLLDLIGLDTIQFIADAAYDELKDPRFVCPSLLRKMVSIGWLGRKTNKGFYDYGKK